MTDVSTDVKQFICLYITSSLDLVIKYFTVKTTISILLLYICVLRCNLTEKKTLWLRKSHLHFYYHYFCTDVILVYQINYFLHLFRKIFCFQMSIAVFRFSRLSPIQAQFLPLYDILLWHENTYMMKVKYFAFFK